MVFLWILVMRGWGKYSTWACTRIHNSAWKDINNMKNYTQFAISWQKTRVNKILGNYWVHPWWNGWVVSCSETRFPCREGKTGSGTTDLSRLHTSVAAFPHSPHCSQGWRRSGLDKRMDVAKTCKATCAAWVTPASQSDDTGRSMSTLQGLATGLTLQEQRYCWLPGQ